MTDTIEPGDLIRNDGVVQISEFPCMNPKCCELIAKGPGWQKHDGSSVNPVPGAMVEAYYHDEVWTTCSSDIWPWDIVQFYRVTTPAPSQPPAPQPGWVATVTIERTDQLTNGQPRVKFPGHWHVGIPRSLFDALVWSPPPPPPWEPEIGKPAWYHGMTYVVRGIYGGFAWAEDVDGDMYSIPLSDLSPPKGGA